MKKTKGITLIALVITIIVLLILAGISISMLSGDNSILSRALQARDVTDTLQIEEKIKLAYAATLINETGNISKEGLKTELQKEFGIENVTDDTIEESSDGKKLTVTIDKVIVELSKAGSINEELNNNTSVTLKSAELTDKYGQNVEYSGYEATDIPSTNWKLFYADESNVYIKSTSGTFQPAQDSWFMYNGELSQIGISLNSGITDWSRSGDYLEEFYLTRNATAYLTNPENWNAYCSSVANWAIGGPTVDIYKASYDSTHTNPITISSEEWGYMFNQDMSRQLTIDTMYFPNAGYILACPAFSANKYFLTARYRTYTERGQTYTEAGLVFYNLDSNPIVTPLVSIPRTHFDIENMRIF